MYFQRSNHFSHFRIFYMFLHHNFAESNSLFICDLISHFHIFALRILSWFIGSLRSPWKVIEFECSIFCNSCMLKFWTKHSCKIWHFTTTWLYLAYLTKPSSEHIQDNWTCCKISTYWSPCLQWSSQSSPVCLLQASLNWNSPTVYPRSSRQCHWITEVVLPLPPWSFCRFRHHRP